MDLKIDFSENDLAPEDTPKAMGGTELIQKWLFDRLDPELKDYFQFIASRKRKLEDKQYQYGVYLGVPYDHGVVIQHAIDPIPKHEKPNDKIVCSYISTPHRGLEILLESWKMMKENMKSEAVDKAELKIFSSFKIYDRPHMDEQFRHVYRKAEDMDQVHYSGSVPNETIREELQTSHILAYPSTYMETACISAIEAMSAKNLVVCPNLGALPETCANFAFMYGYEPNPDRHVQVHAHILAKAINSYWEDGTQSLQDLQKGYFDMFYDWRTRINQWSAFLTSLKENIEAS